MVPPLERKIVAAEQLAQTRAALRTEGRTLVQCHGCFDIVHPGHIRYLQFARQLGDVLVVSLTGDAQIRKGVDRPYIPQELRAENLAALEFVDWVVIDAMPTAAELLEQIKPDVYVKGREYATADDARFAREREIVERNGGRVVFHSGDVVFSSTRLIQSIGPERGFDEPRLRAYCRRNTIDLTRCRAMLGRFVGLRAVVVGDAFRERYVSCDASRTADDAPILSLQQVGTAEFWGGAAGLAQQLAALGAKPLLVSALGADAESANFAAEYAQLGLQANFVTTRGDVPQRTTFVADENKLFRVAQGGSAPLDSVAERHVFEQITAQFGASHLLLWADHGLGLVTPGLYESVTRAARGAGLRVVGHAPGARGELTQLAGAELLTASERQLREAMHDMQSGLPAVAWNLLHANGAKSLIVSLRRGGLIGFDAQVPALHNTPAPERLRSEFVAPIRSSCVDALGCDEALLAAAGLTLACDGGLALAAYLGAVLEALTASRGGAAPLGASELLEFLALRPELRPEVRFQSDAAPLTSMPARASFIEAVR